MSDSEPLLVFPCEFAVKVMGKNQDDFDLIVTEIILRHVDVIKEGALRSRPSKAGNYTAVTVTIDAQSREQVDAIYLSLTSHPAILMAL
jgi:putative lipoic acid-binding regulatory protein